MQIGRKELRGVADVLIAFATCLAVSELQVPLYIALLVIGPAAIWLYRPRPGAR